MYIKKERKYMIMSFKNGDDVLLVKIYVCKK